MRRHDPDLIIEFIILGVILVFILLSTTVRAGTSQIIGQLDWVELSKYEVNSPERLKSKSVVEIITDNRLCNGVHVGNGTIITAHHCIGRNIKVLGERCSVSAAYPALDILHISCWSAAGLPFVSIGKVTSNNIYIIHHQCDWITDPDCINKLMLSPGGILYLNNSTITHTADTLPGSSGAPIFNDKHELIGIHHSGAVDKPENYGSLL